jgi:predicted  nucleic acid-binding Zn-ribbon protein
MQDMRHDLHVLISVAKIDASLSRCRAELETIPEKKTAIAGSLDGIEKTQKAREERFAGMKKDRRSLEAKLEDDTELIKKFKNQLREVKTNKEYSSLLKEIAVVEKDIDTTEEKLLVLMEDLDEQEKDLSAVSHRAVEERERLQKELLDLDARERELQKEADTLQGQKPGFLAELDAQVKKRYARLLSKLGDVAVCNVVDEICQGCFSRLPPQTANEVKLNDRLITCASCGRILVHYEA